MVQKITPNIWFDGNAKEAIDFYVAAFPGGKVITTAYYPESVDEGLADFQLELAGKELSIEYELGGLRFVAINAGPDFTPNPSISFMVNFDPSRDPDARAHLDALWEALRQEGEVLMPLDSYDFSQHYGWVRDKYGVSWQLILTDPDGDERPFIIPALLFGGLAQNRCREAIDFYTSVFVNSKKGTQYPYGQATGPARAEDLMFAEFTLGGEWLVANDSGVEQNFTFNEGVSLSIACEDQAEIDRLWDALSAVAEAEQCGWCKDKFGVSWQIVPSDMATIMSRPDAYAKMMQMKKIIIADF